MVRTYFDSTRDLKKHPEQSLEASTVYMWDPTSPLSTYQDSLFKSQHSATDLKKWASMGPLYGNYGKYIIKQYPIQFIRHFLWPNSHKYYAPPVEFLEYFNSGKDSVPKSARTWFGYKASKVYTRTKSFQVTTLDFYPILSGTMNLILPLALCFFLTLNHLNNKSMFKKGVLLISATWLLNAIFTIGASSGALRFQSFPLLLTITLSILIIDWMCQLIKSHSKMAHDLSPVI